MSASSPGAAWAISRSAWRRRWRRRAFWRRTFQKVDLALREITRGPRTWPGFRTPFTAGYGDAHGAAGSCLPRGLPIDSGRSQRDRARRCLLPPTSHGRALVHSDPGPHGGVEGLHGGSDMNVALSAVVLQHRRRSPFPACGKRSSHATFRKSGRTAQNLLASRSPTRMLQLGAVTRGIVVLDELRHFSATSPTVMAFGP